MSFWIFPKTPGDRSDTNPFPTTERPLFVYTDTGAFAYNDAAKRYEETNQRVRSRYERERLRSLSAVQEEIGDIVETPLPKTVAFDGMLGLGF